MLVIRPDDPERAIRIALDARERGDADQLARLPEAAGAYTVVGFATKPHRGRASTAIVDRMGNVIDRIVPGDSLVTLATDPPIGTRLSFDDGDRGTEAKPS